MRAVVAGLASSFPATVAQDAVWDALFARTLGGSRLARRLWGSAGVATRHGVALPAFDDIRDWSTEERMSRFVDEALPLGKEAVASCLDDAGLEPAEVGLLTVVSCTGYASPGLDVLLARDLGIPSSAERLHVGHMGCYAALPGLAVVSDAAVARGKTAVMVCVELCSLHVQPETDDIGQVVAHALFSDAAAAVAVTPGGPGLEVVDIAARTDASHCELLRWDVTDSGFRVQLSPDLPDAFKGHVAPMVIELLEAHGLAPPDVAAWAIHPGGPRIIDAVGEGLRLEEAALGPTRDVLRSHGNASSPTVLLVLQQIVAGGALGEGDYVVCLAFGAGITLYAALLRYRGPAPAAGGTVVGGAHGGSNLGVYDAHVRRRGRVA